MYYPLLKHGNNEIKALQNLKNSTKKQVTPIIESKRIQPNNLKQWESTFKTLGTYLGSRISDIKFIYDFNCAFEKINFDTKLTTNEEQNIIQFCIQRLNTNDLQFIPCFHHDSPTWLINCIISNNPSEIAVRIKCYTFLETMDSLILQKLQNDLSALNSTKITVILDFYDQETTITRIQNAINVFSKIQDSKIIYLATSCPENAKKGTEHNITMLNPRYELNNYNTLLPANKNLFFGDYTVRLKGEVTGDINYYNTYIKIFYSTETHYWIAKSKLLKYDGDSTFHQVCTKLIKQDFYPGANFSFGDNEISRCAKGIIEISNHQQPIAIGVNHHIETTVKTLNLSPVLPSL